MSLLLALIGAAPPPTNIRRPRILSSLWISNDVGEDTYSRLFLGHPSGTQRLPAIFVTGQPAHDDPRESVYPQRLVPGHASGIQRLPTLFVTGQPAHEDLRESVYPQVLIPGRVSGIQRLPSMLFGRIAEEESFRYDETRSGFTSRGQFLFVQPNIPNTRYWLLYGTAPDAFVADDVTSLYHSQLFVPQFPNAVGPVTVYLWKPIMARGGRGRLGR